MNAGSTTAGAPTRRVVVTGVGLLAPLADDPAALHRALVSGEHAERPASGFDAGALGAFPVCELNGFGPERHLEGGNLRPLDRTGRLAAAAAGLALVAAGWDAEALAEREVGLVLGTMFGSVRTICGFDRRALEAGPGYVRPFDFANTVINAAAGQTAIWHRLRGVNATLAGGSAAGLQALVHAAALIRRGGADALVAGGAEELCFESLHGFSRAGRLAPADGGRPVPFDRGRDGFRLGEGAAFLMLEEENAARARGATVLAVVRGGASGYDPSRGRSVDSASAALERTVTRALEAAGAGADELGAWSASAHGGPHLDRAEAGGVTAALGPAARRLPVTAVKAALGESLGAGGALQTAALLGALAAGELPGIRGFERLDDGLEIDRASAEAQPIDGRLGLVTSLALDGGSAALVVEGAAA